MATLQEVRTTALALTDLHGLVDRGWTFGFNDRKRAYGVCRYGPRRIELNREYAVRAAAADVRDTILHEVAHALAGPAAGHGPVWKGVCRRIGARPVRCGTSKEGLPSQTGKGARYVPSCPSCPSCPVKVYLFRRPKRTTGYCCRRCGPVKGRMTFGPAPKA